MALRFGDRVDYFIPGHGTSGGSAYVAGEMKYSNNGAVLLLVNEGWIGMPIAAAHCTLVSSGHQDVVQAYRDEYLALFPGSLKD